MAAHAGLLALLLPPVSYAPTGSRIAAEQAAEGARLDAVQDSATRVAGGVTVFDARTLLTDWERVCGITAPAGAGYQQRQQAVLAKLAETGGLSIPYFIRLAAGLGYTITITEPQPFRAGTSRAGETLFHGDAIWCWRVNVSGGSNGLPYRFRAGQSGAGERLLAFGDPVLETIFNDLKPAWTYVDFAYLGS
ncbi:YmfQ family protein [Jeongeupia chitinilytica]|uniref:Phage tail protein n=1 Tax=Jeongeupia chitinilytica TaxID=1041641 RepID=A0ABQ3H093_9NEIS|nr:putative phage tail protein [Jeongeupia chitinilytica]GHD63894.1 phage tail protein [Jeongeupia chitinilytica]